MTIDLLCCAEDYDESIELAEAVRSALDCKQGELDGLAMRSCWLSDSSEYYEGDAYVQALTFTIKI